MIVYIRKSAVHGRGVFVSTTCQTGALLEVCEVIPYDGPDKTSLWEHQLAWTDTSDCIASGCALFYNHSDDPNAVMIRHPDTEQIAVFARRSIAAGGEVFIKYKCKPWW